MVLMAVSVPLRLGYYWGFWKGIGAFELYTQVLLPWASALLFIGLLLLFGPRDLAVTALPVWLGVAFFVAKATGFAWWHALLCILLYLLAGVLYTLVVFGRISSRLPLLPLFGLPLLVHILMDFGVIGQAPSQTLREWLPELSVLCIMLALLSLAFGMRRVRPAEPCQEGEEEN